MAGDDILWKNVEAIQKQSPAAPEPVARRPEMSRERIADKVMASPSSGSANDVDTFPPNGSTHTNGSIAVSSASQRLPIRLPVKTSERTAALPCGQLLQVPGRPTRRRPERYAFQFWSDQITRLKQLRRMLNLANDPEERTEVTLSDLVREAVDEYLDRQTQPSGTERPAGSPRHITGRAYGRTASTMNSHFYHQFILIDFRLLEDRRFLKFLGSSEFATYLVLRRNVWRSAKPPD